MVDPNQEVNNQGEQPADQVADNPNINPNNVQRITLKVPPFWKKNPQLWFRQLEAQFTTSKIVTELTKFNHIIGVIESDILEHVSDLVLTPPAVDPYKALKARLIKQFAATESQKMKTLLEELTLGDSKPSDLLRKMRELSCQKVQDEFLRALWLQRLPTTIHTVLATNTADLDQLAVAADAMFEVTQASSNSIREVSSTSNYAMDDLFKVVCNLEGKIDSLKKDSRMPKKSTRQRTRSRSSTPVKASAVSKKKLCYYHSRFANRAQHCKHPCSWVNSKSKN